jgi:hypothetical protein
VDRFDVAIETHEQLNIDWPKFENSWSPFKSELAGIGPLRGVDDVCMDFPLHNKSSQSINKV